MKTNDSKQVAAFEKLLGNCNAFGAMYNPKKASVKITALNEMLVHAQQMTAAVNSARNARTVAINARQDAFNDLPKLATRIVSALIATDAPASLIADIRLIGRRFKFRSVRKQRGGESSDQLTGLVSDHSRGPISHLDYESKIVNFGNIIDLLKTETSYEPNEADLTIESLNAYLVSLKEKHKAVATAQLAVKNATMAKDKALFHANTGIYGTSKVVKEYVRSVFGTGSMHFIEVKSIPFRKA
jgi:hypothetical protein